MLQSIMPIWSEIDPKTYMRFLSRKDDKHEWLIFFYYEAPAEREDGRHYQAIHFRDRQRTRYGVKVFAELAGYTLIRKTAARIVRDDEFRKALLSHDSALPEIWKQHRTA